MKRTHLVTLVVCLVLASVSTLYPKNAGKSIDRLMNALYQNGQFNGTILVKKSGNIIYERAFGLANREWGMALSADEIEYLVENFTRIGRKVPVLADLRPSGKYSMTLRSTIIPTG